MASVGRRVRLYYELARWHHTTALTGLFVDGDVLIYDTASTFNLLSTYPTSSGIVP
jgi:hypothetical protein